MKSNIGRLQEVLDLIDDKKLKEIIDGMFKLEISYRSAERSNFPRQKVRDLINGVARTIESNKSEKTEIDEVSKD